VVLLMRAGRPAPEHRWVRCPWISADLIDRT